MGHNNHDTTSSHEWQWRIGSHRAIEQLPPRRSRRSRRSTPAASWDQIVDWTLGVGVITFVIGMMLLALDHETGRLPQVWVTIGASSLFIGFCALGALGAMWWLKRSYRRTSQQDGTSPWGRR